MVSISRDGGPLRISAAGYALTFREDRPYAFLHDADDQRWAELCLLGSAHTTTGLDDTAAVGEVRVTERPDAVVVEIDALSSRWQQRRLVIECRDDRFSVHLELVGRGDLTDLHLLGGLTSAHPRWGSGMHRSACHFASLLSPEPSDPRRAVLPAGFPADVDVVGSSLPGRGHWFFTPPPFCFVASRSEPPPPPTAEAEALPIPAGPWLTLGVLAERGAWTFTGLHYEPGERTFALRLAYEGQTSVEGAFRSPAVVFLPGAPDPYGGIRSYARLAAAPAHQPPPPDWWRRPILCGWGEQCHLAGGLGHAPDLSRQLLYDRFLATLGEYRLRPGTIVIDDKWQAAYGTNRVDTEKWPDLAGWIAARHGDGQRVLLWFKAWDPEGVAPELCVRNAAGRAVTTDPSNPAYRELLRESVTHILSPDGYGADGLKIDFTGNAPSGPLAHHGPEWGVELLRQLLVAIRDAARAAKPEALLMAHTPNPYLADVVDVIRLNDVMRLDDPMPDAPLVAHMRHRAAIVRAACPGLLIDADNWALPDLATWRRYVEVQPELGIPSLYYVTHIDRSGEHLTDADYDLLRRVWGQ